jgi:hypothetical protein
MREVAGIVIVVKAQRLMRQGHYTRVASEEGARAQTMRTMVSMVTDWCRLTNHSSERVRIKEPSPDAGVRAVQLNR